MGLSHKNQLFWVNKVFCFPSDFQLMTLFPILKLLEKHTKDICIGLKDKKTSREIKKKTRL